MSEHTHTINMGNRTQMSQLSYDGMMFTWYADKCNECGQSFVTKEKTNEQTTTNQQTNGRDDPSSVGRHASGDGINNNRRPNRYIQQSTSPKRA